MSNMGRQDGTLEHQEVVCTPQLLSPVDTIGQERHENYMFCLSWNIISFIYN